MPFDGYNDTTVLFFPKLHPKWLLNDIQKNFFYLFPISSSEFEDYYIDMDEIMASFVDYSVVVPFQTYIDLNNTFLVSYDKMHKIWPLFNLHAKNLAHI